MAMSMRSRGAAATMNRSRSGVRPVYEDFKPVSEWKHEEAVDILLYHLPGFVKEQIRILAESRGILRVRGERSTIGNKWSRFQEEVLVPEDCNMSEIRAKFEGGILQITMPKKMINTHQKHIPKEQLEPPTTNVRKPKFQTNPQLLQEELPSKPTVPSNIENAQVRTSINPPPPTPKITDLGELKPKKFHDEFLPKETISSVARSSKDLVGEEVFNPPLRVPDNSKQFGVSDGKFHQGTFDYNKGNDIQDNAQQKDIKDTRYGIEHHDYEHGNEIKRGNIDFIPHVKENKEVYYDDPEKACTKESTKIYGVDDYRREVKNYLPWRFDEDRQLLMNMGAAILVIMALGTYISYSFGSFRQSND